jgi:hypothetical protein
MSATLTVLPGGKTTSRPSTVVQPHDPRDRSDRAWSTIADTVEQTLQFPGLTVDDRRLLREALWSCRRAAGEA